MFRLSLLLLVAGCGSGTKKPDMGPPDMAPMCPKLGTDTKAAMRDACAFTAGAMPADTLPITEEQRKAIPIKHIIVLMKENRSFDHLFGALSKQGQPDAEPTPDTFSNPDANGMTVTRFHAPPSPTQTCINLDPPHQWVNMHNMVGMGTMDGFVKNATLATQGSGSMMPNPPSDGHFVMSYYDQTDLPFYYWLASTFALADHDFASVRSGTWANRDYLVAATSLGIQNTNDPPGDQLPATTPLIFDKLDAAKISWQVYSDETLGPLEFSVDWTNRKQWANTAAIFTELANSTPDKSTLPQVAFIDATTAFTPPDTDEHPPADLQTGEAWTRKLVDALTKSKLWGSTVLFYTYDEAGGFADHVPPGNSCAPSPDQSMFTELGVRIPLVAISPYAKPHYVSKAVHQHTSITRFIETVFNLPALTARDANSDALLDMFDFCTPALLTLPTAMPAAGTGECATPP